MARDLRSYFLKSIPDDVLNNALWEPLDREQGLLELIILRVRTRPDCQLIYRFFNTYTTDFGRFLNAFNEFNSPFPGGNLSRI